MLTDYIVIVCFLIFSFLFSLVLLLITMFISTRLKNTNKDKLTSYECGFQNFDQNARQFVTVPFFFIGILFLLFDLELIFLLPWVLNLHSLPNLAFSSVFMFIFFAILAYLYELKSGLLTWSNKKKKL